MNPIANYPYEFRFVTSLEKIFPDSPVLSLQECSDFTALKGETLSFQLAYRSYPLRTKPCAAGNYLRLRTCSALDSCLTIRQVRLVPSSFPACENHDGNYIKTEPGLYPDLLEPCDGLICISPNAWKSLWIDFDIPETAEAGAYPIDFIVTDPDGSPVCELRAQVEIIGAVLPKQETVHTEWISYDCIADYYGVSPLSEEWWRITEEFIKTAVKRGINMILTPIFTPPLDTAVGTERTPVQLVGMTLESGTYRFDFSALKRFIDLCLACGAQHFEMAHLFSQWGAKFAPNIYVTEDGVKVHKFGWHTPADCAEYKDFLDAFLPALTAKLTEWGVDRKTVFHISDEPSPNILEQYKTAKSLVSGHLKGYPIIDALSHVEYYRNGLCEHPVPANDAVHDFIEAGVADLWTYYCCGQGRDVSNLFFAMPSARNRILGVQMYLYHIAGFLHWGYNFYNSALSLHRINPFLVTDGEGAFPSGDPFLIYPGADGKPLESIRIMVLNEAFQDVRALSLLESLTDFAAVKSLIEEGIPPITFYSYPKDPAWLVGLRERVNRKIKELL